jgi:hypothetical protein
VNGRAGFDQALAFTDGYATSLGSTDQSLLGGANPADGPL